MFKRSSILFHIGSQRLRNFHRSLSNCNLLMLCFHRGRCIPCDPDFLPLLAGVAVFCCKSRRSALRKFPFRVLKVPLLFFFLLSFIMVWGLMMAPQSYVPPRFYGLMGCLPSFFCSGHAATIRPLPSWAGLSSVSVVFLPVSCREFPVMYIIYYGVVVLFFRSVVSLRHFFVFFLKKVVGIFGLYLGKHYFCTRFADRTALHEEKSSLRGFT